MQSLVPKLNLSWNGEPYPDHSTIHRGLREDPQEYLEDLLDRTAALRQRDGVEGGGPGVS